MLTHSTSRRAIDVLGDFSESVVSGNPGKSRGFPDADESKKGKNVVTAGDEGRNVKGGRDKAEGMGKAVRNSGIIGLPDGSACYVPDVRSGSWRRGSWNRQDRDARKKKKRTFFFSISRPTGDRAFCPVRYVSPVKEKGPEVAGVIFASSESPIESATEIGRLIPSISKTCRNFKLKNARSFKGRMYSKGTKSFYYGFMSQN